MAVWASPSFKMDCAKLLWQVHPQVCAHVLGPTLSPFLSPDYGTTGLTDEDDWDTLAQVAEWKERDHDRELAKSLLEFVEPAQRHYVGTGAVYQLVNAVVCGRFSVSAAHDWNVIDQMCGAALDVVSYSTQTPPALAQRAFRAHDLVLRDKGRRLEDAAEGFKRLRFIFSKSSDSEEEIEVDQTKVFGEGRRVFFGRAFRGLLVMRGASELVNKALYLARAHLDFVVGALLRLANSCYYYARKFAAKPGKAAEVAKFLDWEVRTAARAAPASSYKVARAFHKARTLTQMGALESLLEAAVAGETADYKTDGLGDILPLAEFAAMVAPFNQLEQLELAHLYKWMPPPDFDVTKSFGIVKDWHHNPRPSGCDEGAPDHMVEMYQRVRNERKLNAVLAQQRLTGELPADVPRRGNGPNFVELCATQLRPFMLYHDFGKDIVSQIKDKATVSGSMEVELAGRTPKEDRSYLLWYMRMSQTVNTIDAKRAHAAGTAREDNYARVAYKPESHKPDSRLFFMMPPVNRTIMGELESNLARVAEAYPGSLQGKSAALKDRICATIMDVHSPPPGVPEGADYEVFVVTFDLTKFSPKSNRAVTADYHAWWANVFGRPELADMVSLGCDSAICHTECGMRMWYQNQGADLEGMRGRMMTLFHSDLLGAACRLARERGLIFGRSVLAVFIDDGAVKVAANTAGAGALANCQAFLQVMQEVYASAGQDANPAKTVASARGGEILADLYFDGLKVPVGLKAAQRIYPDYENPACTLPEELDSVAAACQGCVKDGGGWFETYAVYVEACLKVISRWSSVHLNLRSATDMSVKLYTPKALGGFGLSSLQSLVSTAAVSGTAEGLGVLHSIARNVPGLRSRVERVVTAPVVIRDPLSILRDPLRVRSTTPVMVENRLMMEVVKWLEENAGEYAQFMAAYRDLDLRAHAAAVGEAILSTGVVNLPAVERAWKATPLAYVESIVGKFKRAASIITLLGYRKLTSVRKKNLADVVAVLSA